MIKRHKEQIYANIFNVTVICIHTLHINLQLVTLHHFFLIPAALVVSVKCAATSARANGHRFDSESRQPQSRVESKSAAADGRKREEEQRTDNNPADKLHCARGAAQLRNEDLIRADRIARFDRHRVQNVSKRIPSLLLLHVSPRIQARTLCNAFESPRV